jgi:hypothetical protein
VDAVGGSKRNDVTSVFGGAAPPFAEGDRTTACHDADRTWQSSGIGNGGHEVGKTWIEAVADSDADR